MTFTSTTIRKLRALGLDQETFDKVLEIFEEAKESKPKKKGGAADRWGEVMGAVKWLNPSV